MKNLIFILAFLFIIISDIIINTYSSNYSKRFNQLKYKSYFTIYLTLFLLTFSLFSCLNLLGLIEFNTVLNFKFDSVFYIIEKTGDVSITPNVSTTINISNAVFNARIPASAVNNLAAAASAAGGGALAFKVAKYIGGSPAVKLSAAVGTMAAIQSTSAIMGKVFNAGEKHNFIGNLLSDPNTTNLSNQFTEFPLNLLPEMNTLINVQIFFLFLMFNFFISNAILKLDYSSIIPNNRLGEIIQILINRYISIWNKSINFIILLSYFSFVITVIGLKIGFISIISAYV